MVLGILYESFIHPLTILSALPFAGFGALLTLLVFHVDLSIYAFVGIIMLVGLVKKNGIMMVDFALEAQKSGKDADRGDLRGVRGPLPADHDDHDGRADGHDPHRPRLRRRRRVAPSARPRRRRRPALLADADALRDAGLLRLHGQAAEEAARRRTGRRDDAIGDEFAALQPVAEEQPAGVMFGTVKPEPAT